MSWGEIKKALNSNPSGKPLNELIAETAGLTGLKRVQRGVTAVEGNVTIQAVNMDKSFVVSVSKGSAGTVAATGNITGSSGEQVNGSGGYASGGTTSYISKFSGTISGGTTNLTVKEYSAKLVNETTISCDGPCEWQAVEFN